MKTTLTLLDEGAYDAGLGEIYGAAALDVQRRRYMRAAEAFEKLYPGCNGVRLFSVPGRTEICGNHTDHNRGRVLAAAVNLDIIAVAAAVEGDEIRVSGRAA